MNDDFHFYFKKSSMMIPTNKSRYMWFSTLSVPGSVWGWGLASFGPKSITDALQRS